MQRILIGSPPETTIQYDSRVSSTWDLFNLLPYVTISHRYPGLDPWAHTIADRVPPEAQADFSLLTRILYGSISYLKFAFSRAEDAPAFLTQVDNVTAEELQRAVLQGCAIGGLCKQEEAEALLAQPERLRAMIQTSQGPMPDEELPVDANRLVALLQQPQALKELVSIRLRALWEEHLKPHWERSLPSLERSAAEARRHFAEGKPELVIQAVTGKPMSESVQPHLRNCRSLVFYPSCILGPYMALIVSPADQTVRVMYGAGIQPGATEQTPNLPGGLLPALTALADETRLRMLEVVRTRGRGCAQDFMSELGLSQPAASRHLRLLESTGVLRVERIEGVKWYQISPDRVQAVTESIQQFLLGHGHRRA